MNARLPLAISLFIMLLPGLCPAQEGTDDVVKQVLAEIEALKKRMEAIEKRLDALEKGESSPVPAFNPGPKPGSPGSEPDAPPLPVNPTKEQAREYVQAFKEKLKGQTWWVSSDPTPMLLARVGKENVDVLLDALYGIDFNPFDLAAVDAIRLLAGIEHCDAIVSKLPSCHDLVKVVLEKGWEAKARDVLILELKECNETLPSEWVTAAVRLKDPEANSAVLDYLKDGGNPYGTYQALSGIGDIPPDELDKAVTAMWARFKNMGVRNPDNKNLAARIAACHGCVDALEHTAKLLGRPGNNAWAGLVDLRPLVLSLIPFRGTNKEVRTWITENRDRISFDQTKRKYVLNDSEEKK